MAAAALVAVAGAQPRAELTLGVADAPVAGAWTPLRAVVRDAPGATFRLDVDAGGFERGEVLQSATARVSNAGGVQRLDVVLPLPPWRRVSWRIEQDERVLASGSVGARERDERSLAVVVSSRPTLWGNAFGSEARVVGATAADLPATADGWDGVNALLIDGSAAAPDRETVITAAAAGVRVLLPRDGAAGYAALSDLVSGGARRVGAGTIEALSDASTGSLPPAPDAAWPRDLRRTVVAAGAAALDGPTWDHLPRLWVLAGTASFAALVWTLLYVGGPAGTASAAMVVLAAGVVATSAAPSDPTPASTASIVLVGDGLGVRVPLIALARLPRGESEIAGLFRPVDVRSVRWTERSTFVPLPAGGRARLTGAADIVTVPDDVREGLAGEGVIGEGVAGEGDAASDAGVPAELRAALPTDASARWDGKTWWVARTGGAP